MNFDEAAMFNRLSREEAFRLKPYDDKTGKELVPGSVVQGKITIAIGVNLSDGLTPAEAIYLTQGRIRAAQHELIRNCPWFLQLDGIRQEVLVDLCFNMGWPVLSQFHNTLAAFQAGDWAAAGAGMRHSAWYGQVGARAEPLCIAAETGAFPA